MKLLIIDPNLSYSSPSMKGVARSLNDFKAAGFEIEVWCWHCDDGMPVDDLNIMPRWGNVRFFGLIIFSCMVSLRAWFLYKLLRHPMPNVIYSVAPYLANCDVAHVHFSPFDWETRQKTLSTRSLRDLAERLLNGLSLIQTRHFLQTTRAKTVICVSDAVAADTRHENAALNIHVLPNSYDPIRFNKTVCDTWRSETRFNLGIKEGDCVFVFVSTGHYRRKGFFLAVEALRQLRQTNPEVRFLVVGGTEKRLSVLKRELEEVPEWMIFTGMVKDVERYFAASDAFLFPSYSEAFALVEVEAAACGLPLFLTPHHGSEMILEEGVNGRFLEFDAGQIAGILKSFVDRNWIPKPGIHLKHSLNAVDYAQRLTAVLMSQVKSVSWIREPLQSQVMK